MNKAIFIVCGFAFTLMGCVTSSEQFVQPQLTNTQIIELNNAALCSLSNTMIDPRISAEVKSRKLDCDPDSLTCSAKGIKKGTKKFSQCKANEITERSINSQKRANPALGYCMDSGFKIGTDAMATCMTAYNQERHNQFMFERQQTLSREEMYQNAAQERARRASSEPELIPVIIPQPNRVYEPIVKNPERTECQPNLGGGFDCTTY